MAARINGIVTVVVIGVVIGVYIGVVIGVVIGCRQLRAIGDVPHVPL